MIIYQNKKDKCGDNKIIQKQNDFCSWKPQSEKLSGHLPKNKFNYWEIWVSEESGEIFLMILLHKWHFKWESQDSKSKKDGKDQESIQLSTTPDPGYHMGKWQKHNLTSQTRAKRSALSQQWPQGSNEQTQKHDNHKT